MTGPTPGPAFDPATDPGVAPGASSAEGRSRLRAALRRARERHGLGPDAALGLAADALDDRLEAGHEAGRDAALAREARHRAANQLQLVLSALRRRAREAGLSGPALCAACVGQVGAAAALNEVVHGRGSTADADAAGVLRSVCRLFGEALGDPRVRIETDLQPVRAPRKTVEALALAVNEAMTNSVKHAFPDGRPGVIRVSLRPIGERALEATVADDGVGADADDAQAPLRDGLRLIARILSAPGGVARRLPTPQGYAVRFELPIAPAG